MILGQAWNWFEHALKEFHPIVEDPWLAWIFIKLWDISAHPGTTSRQCPSLLQSSLHLMLAIYLHTKMNSNKTCFDANKYHVYQKCLFYCIPIQTDFIS